MSFQIKKSDYDGLLLDPDLIASDPSANEAYFKSQIYTGEFGLYLYKFYKFKAKLNDGRDTTIDLDIATQKKQLLGFNLPFF